MNRFIAINPNRCVACGTCRAECSEGHRKAGLLDEPRLALYESRDVVASVTCHHCAGAPCLKVCPVNAIRRDPDGCIRVDEHQCIGCKLCAVACPFGAIHMYGTPISGIEGKEYLTPTFPASLNPILRWEVGVYAAAVKCDLCAYDDCHPHCVDACITNALRLVEDADDEHEIAARRVKAGQDSLAMLGASNPDDGDDVASERGEAQ
ncbi:4Fe-4S binding protein [Curtanaerobium respiraculi]|uniref:4Fe-4S binding protein n=1 Tax=Curtanaerobium respiraculi TaxID=2949669 RepID=UPI0024B323D9|nr:4Fe-4S binding protein [Curtanaerobium respiraculi]